jgi:hypothetical protein
LLVYDVSGHLLRTLSLGGNGTSISAFNATPNPWDPGSSALLLKSGPWTASFDGKDSSGNFLSNGDYLLQLESTQGGQVQKATLNITVIRSESPLDSAIAWPNPASKGASSLYIAWTPASQDVDGQIFNQAGELVLEMGHLSGGKAALGLKGLSDGVYFIALRIPGQRRPRLIKVALAR